MVAIPLSKLIGLAKKGSKKVNVAMKQSKPKQQRRKQQPARNNRNVGRNGARTTMNGIAAAYGTTMRMGARNGNRAVVADCEPLQQLIKTTDTSHDQVWTWFFQPGTSTLPRLDQMGGMYEQYRVKKLLIRYKTACGSSQGGQVVMAIDYDPQDAFVAGAYSPGTAFITIGGTRPNVMAPVWNPELLLSASPSECNRGKWMYTNAGASVHPGLDAACVIYAGVDAAVPQNFEIGSLFVEYEIEFNNPVPPTGSTRQQSVSQKFVLGDVVVGTNVPTAVQLVRSHQLELGDAQPWVTPGFASAPSLTNIVLAADKKTVTETWTQAFTPDKSGMPQLLKFDWLMGAGADATEASNPTGLGITVTGTGVDLNKTYFYTDATNSAAAGMRANSVGSDPQYVISGMMEWFGYLTSDRVSSTVVINTLITYVLASALTSKFYTYVNSMTAGTPLFGVANWLTSRNLVELQAPVHSTEFGEQHQLRVVTKQRASATEGVAATMQAMKIGRAHV